MAKSSWLGRWFGRGAPSKGGAPTADAHGGEHIALPVDRATVGLCFDYERDLALDSASLSDEGLEHILTVLQRLELRATFNCAAKLCEEVSHQIRMIADCGHELAVYGYAGESWNNLEQGALKQLVYQCRNAFSHAGLSPIGFRSKSTQCDARVARELALQRFRYNSQHDHAKDPYIVLDGEQPFARVPVCTDDRGYIRAKKDREHKANEMISKHHRYLRKAITRKHFVAIGFHPWILAEEQSRMREWEYWLETAVKGGARVGPMEDALPAAYRKLTPTDEQE